APQRAAHARAAAVTLKAPARVDEGDRVVLTGLVRVRPAGGTVTVQRMFKYTGEWRNVGRAKVGGRGGVRFVDVAHRGGVRYYRLVVPTRHSRVVSKGVAVTVWTWHDLSDEPYSSRLGTFQRQYVNVLDGIFYDDGIVADDAIDSGFMEWDLEDTRGVCTKLRAHVASQGIDYAHGSVLVDGVEVGSGDFVDGYGPFGVSKDISGARSVRFEWSKPADSSESLIMYDSAVYCSY
ncbi:hypothetical protein ACFP8W_00840, partial [Nocardioides hankookensis]